MPEETPWSHNQTASPGPWWPDGAVVQSQRKEGRWKGGASPQAQCCPRGALRVLSHPAGWDEDDPQDSSRLWKVADMCRRNVGLEVTARRGVLARSPQLIELLGPLYVTSQRFQVLSASV